MFQNLRLLFSASNCIIRATTPITATIHEPEILQERNQFIHHILSKQAPTLAQLQSDGEVVRSRIQRTPSWRSLLYPYVNSLLSTAGSLGIWLAAVRSNSLSFEFQANAVRFSAAGATCSLYKIYQRLCRAQRQPKRRMPLRAC